jgi:hypothetical protein
MGTQALEPDTRIGPPSAAVDLYWIPVGAGQHVVRWSGKLFEAISARLQRRSPCDLYHSALVVFVPQGRFVIEQTPITDGHGDRRGVVLEGPVGTRLAGRFRHFRYEIRRWRDGVIPDLAAAVSSPVRVASNLAQASQILDLVPSLPPLVWGRDQRHTGEMWNSNAVISWLLVRAGIDTGEITPPPRGRAPGWRAGVLIASRDAARVAGITNAAQTPTAAGWVVSSGLIGSPRFRCAPMSTPRGTIRMGSDAETARPNGSRPAPQDSITGRDHGGSQHPPDLAQGAGGHTAARTCLAKSR